MYKCGSAGQKLWAEIPICTRNTVVGVHGYVQCLNLVTAPVTVSSILKALWVTLIAWQSLVISQRQKQGTVDSALGHLCMELPWRILLVLCSSLLHNDIGN